MLTLVASIEGESSVMNIDARDEMNLTQCSRGYWNIQKWPIAIVLEYLGTFYLAAQCSREGISYKIFFLNLECYLLGYCFSMMREEYMMLPHCKRRHKYGTGDYEE